jgi:hypothetical protein
MQVQKLTRPVCSPDDTAHVAPTRRKVVQLMSMGESYMFALCDDGTIWQQSTRTKGEGWQAVIDVPQGEMGPR